MAPGSVSVNNNMHEQHCSLTPCARQGCCEHSDGNRTKLFSTIIQILTEETSVRPSRASGTRVGPVWIFHAELAVLQISAHSHCQCLFSAFFLLCELTEIRSLLSSEFPCSHLPQQEFLFRAISLWASNPSSGLITPGRVMFVQSRRL